MWEAFGELIDKLYHQTRKWKKTRIKKIGFRGKWVLKTEKALKTGTEWKVGATYKIVRSSHVITAQ